MRRLLLVTHRPIDRDGGPAARWRAFARYLPEHGWQVDVLSAAEHIGASEFKAGAARAVAARAALMARLGRASAPLFALAGVRPDALPLSMLWVPRGARMLRQRLKHGQPNAILATGPPIAGLLAARLADVSDAPLVFEFRDLWADSPAFDAGGPLLPAIERWLLHGARGVVACTPEAVADLQRRHPHLGDRVAEISNGFDPAIRAIAAGAPSGGNGHGASSRRSIVLLHSGTLIPARPIAPLVEAMRDSRLAGSCRLVLHGYLSPTSRAEVVAAAAAGTPIEVVAPSPWEEAVHRIGDADACLVTQAREAGDATAVASKVYEYLALGKPILCLTDGGASEALLRRLGADQLCARLDARETIVRALLRLRDNPPGPVPFDRLEPYDRRVLAGRMAALLEEVAGGHRTSAGR